MLSLPPRRSGSPRQPVYDGPCCLHLHGCRLGLRGYHFRGHLCVRLRYGLETRPHPTDEAVERLQEVGFSSPCSPSYRALAFPLVGLPPTEHASLRWTHNRTEPFRCYPALQWARFTASGYQVSHPLLRLSYSTCGPSPCGWLSQPRTTTTTL